MDTDTQGHDVMDCTIPGASNAPSIPPNIGKVEMMLEEHATLFPPSGTSIPTLCH